ncbi:hypothetical protein IE53DRAFT_212491 [Violaceomyces palustris]|uniref:Uncharacterized protein n=1 Tax=Violaceomyces palustris TaxID=1673888 RepID=A0ACD0NQM1_9BASI|nr:hypothetical protein IE53DRAFT_212491 [Violaceomyces palustris]
MTSETQLDHPSRITRFARLLGLKAASPPAPPKPKRPQLEPIIPRTPLEARRHILAGRRRAKRIDDAKRGEARDGVPTEVKRMVREQVLDMSRLVNRRRMSGDEQGGGNQFVEEVGHGGLETRPGEDPKIRIKPWDHEAWLKLKDEDQNHDPLTNPKRPGESRTTDQQQQQQQQQQQEQIEMLELEFVVRAYLEKDPAVKVFEEGGYVEVHLPGDVPLRQSLEKVRRLAEKVSSQTGMDQNQDRFGGGLSSSSPDGLDVAVVGRATSEQAPSVASPITQGDPPPPSPISPKEAPPPRKGRQRRRSIFSPPKEWTERETRLEAAVSTELIPPPPLDVSQTLVRTLHIVFPEHTNSVSVLFGGQLMDWMEEAALLSVRFVGRARRWNTVALDGLEFPQAVGVGE